MKGPKDLDQRSNIKAYHSFVFYPTIEDFI